MLHTVIQIDHDILVSEVVDFFFVFLDFQGLILQLFLLFGEFHALAAAGLLDGFVDVGKLGAVALLT